MGGGRLTGNAGYVPRHSRADGLALPDPTSPARLADYGYLPGKFTGIVSRSSPPGEGGPLRTAVGGPASHRRESRCRGGVAEAR
jgi:hypothetical protein